MKHIRLNLTKVRRQIHHPTGALVFTRHRNGSKFNRAGRWIWLRDTHATGLDISVFRLQDSVMVIRLGICRLNSVQYPRSLRPSVNLQFAISMMGATVDNVC